MMATIASASYGQPVPLIENKRLGKKLKLVPEEARNVTNMEP